MDEQQAQITSCNILSHTNRQISVNIHLHPNILQTEYHHPQQEGAGPVRSAASSRAAPWVDDGLVDDVERQDRSTRLVAVAHAVKAAVEAVDVVLREAAAHTQRAAA